MRLSVRALRGDEIRGTRADVAARALFADGELAFRTGDQLRTLPASVSGPLLEDVEEALERISPIFGLALEDPWYAALIAGARDPSNQVAAYALGSSFELIGKVLVDRPALYFGVPPGELVDAHWFAYRAAKAHYFRLLPSS